MTEPEADNLRLSQNAQDTDISDETQDFRFLAAFNKSDHASIPKRGEKDFEPDGTDLQDRVLVESRRAMHDALCGERKHTSKVHVEATWRPTEKLAEVHVAKGPHFKTLGMADKRGVWLLPEETIYMVERGALECWWEEDVPMSLQGVYASCLEGCGGLERYQVYAYLKRAGYILQRAPSFFDNEPVSQRTKILSTVQPPSTSPGIFWHIFSSLFGPKRHSSKDPLIEPRTYYSYDSIYERLALIRSHHPPHEPTTLASLEARAPYRIAYHVWKPRPSFKKSDPPPPDFRLAVVSARDSSVPTLSELSALFDSVPVDEKAAGKNQFHKLKDGYRNVILAIVDSGITSFLKLGDVGFGDEMMYKRRPGVGRGGKFGKRGRGGGGVGRGGRQQGQPSR